MVAALTLRVELGFIPGLIQDQPAVVYDKIAYPALVAASEFMAGRLALNTPVGATGKARQSVVASVNRGGAFGDFVGRVDYAEPASSYILFVDQDTRPHWPPTAPIAYWASRVLSIDDPRVVFLIRRKISRVGTKGQRFVERTAVENAGQAAQVAADAANRAIARL